MAREPWALPDWTEPKWTPRQADVLKQIGHGRTNPEIAADLGISLAGAKWHVSEVLSKLGVLSREDIAAYWRWRTSRRTRTRRWARGVAAFVMGKAGVVALTAAGTAVVAAFAIVVLAQDDGTVEAAPVDEAAEATATVEAATNTAMPASLPADVPSTPTIQAPIAIIDWVDFFRFGGLSYSRKAGPGSEIDEANLGEQYAKVEFKLSGNVTDPSYRPKDGDAAFLEVGTALHTINGYSPCFRLAAWQDGRLLLYEAFANPAATRGGELLDIQGKVVYIGINSPIDGREVAVIDDAEQVAMLVEMVLAAPLGEPDADRGEESFTVVFHLVDGTDTRRAYRPGPGELSGGIMAPPEFGVAVERAWADRYKQRVAD